MKFEKFKKFFNFFKSFENICFLNKKICGIIKIFFLKTTKMYNFFKL
jgi:hypothetical protein